MSCTYSFEAVNSANTTVATFSELDLARRWAKANARFHDGLRIEAVTRTTRRQTVYRPRGDLRAVA